MRVLISADMEGATGVTCPEDCRPDSPQWDGMRHLFTGDAAAVAHGYHSGPGTEGALSHTWIGYEVFCASLNGRPMSEGYLNALLAAEYGSPVALVSGDDVTCAEAEQYAPNPGADDQPGPGRSPHRASQIEYHLTEGMQ